MIGVRDGSLGDGQRGAPDLPVLALDPATLGDLDADLDREWLVTNGRGGYALGTLCGATTRSYHGLLVAATRPPVGRTVLVAKVDESVTLPDGELVLLGTNEYAGGTIYPRGFARLSGFALDGLIPTWTLRLTPNSALEKRVWMERDANLTFVQYRHRAIAPTASAAPVTLTLTPFCLDRDHHAYTTGAAGWHFLVDVAPGGNACTVRAFAGALPYQLIAGPSARFTPSGVWNERLFHRAERDRGLPDTEDAYVPGSFSLPLADGETATLVLSAEPELPSALAGLGGGAHEAVATRALARERARQAALLSAAGQSAANANAFVARLTLAADQFLVARPVAASSAAAVASADGSAVTGSVTSGGPALTPAVPLMATTTTATTLDATERMSGETVIAGYPWFGDWGRDTMIALPGLTLATGRYAEACTLLATFARYVSQGMLPNRFPDDTETPDYHTADATLWYFSALAAYLDATDDERLLAVLFPTLADIVAWHVRGTRFGIGVDLNDGLLRAGVPGVQLTWMDAKAGDWVVTPRIGKPVEINALWYRALWLMADWARRLGRDPAEYERLRDTVAASYFARYWYPAGGYLYDVVDVDGRAGAVDWSLRPNQLFALSLADALIPPAAARSLLAVAERELLTPLGLRTLAASDPHFIGTYASDQRTRDAAYHQGTVWPWLLGAYAGACAAVYPANEVHARIAALIEPFQAHLRAAGIGTISEIAEGAPPYRPCGCVAQAWSVAELLRIARMAS
ncbi:MAG: amylo-alpha-1,6-glucosidase [Ktedonobacterales bacterium]